LVAFLFGIQEITSKPLCLKRERDGAISIGSKANRARELFLSNKWKERFDACAALCFPCAESHQFFVTCRKNEELLY